MLLAVAALALSQLAIKRRFAVSGQKQLAVKALLTPESKAYSDFEYRCRRAAPLLIKQRSNTNNGDADTENKLGTEKRRNSGFEDDFPQLSFNFSFRK